MHVLFRLGFNRFKYFSRLLLLLLLSVVVAGVENGSPAEEATLVAVSERGVDLNRELLAVLRGLQHPQTINTDVVDRDAELLEELTASLLRWQEELELVLAKDTEGDSRALAQAEGQKAHLVNLYFVLLANLIQVKKIIVQHIDWQHAGHQLALTVPLTLVWSRNQMFQQLLAQRVQVGDYVGDGRVRLQLRDAYVDGLQIAALAVHAERGNHLAAVKYFIYLTLYRQLVQNEHYRGTTVEQLPELLEKGVGRRYDLDLRQRIIAHQRRDRRAQFLHAALLAAQPQLRVPATGLQQPLLANWSLYERLHAAHPDLMTFTTPLLAQQLYALLSEVQRTAIGVSDAEEMRRFLLLIEHLALPAGLQQELRHNAVAIDGSDGALQALQQLQVQARQHALLSSLLKLRFERSKIQPLLEAIQARQQTLLATGDMQAVSRWYAAAKKLVPDIQQRARLSFLRSLSYAAWKVDTAERSGKEPLNLQILRKALLRSIYITDFSGEFQQSLGAILQARGYGQSRGVFFTELARHLQRLVPQQPPSVQTLRLLSQDDIVRTYVNPALVAERTETTATAHAVQRKAMLHHVTQVKALLQHGHWFGYFTNKGDALPSIDTLPLSDRQRADYWRELRFAHFDNYPFMLLSVAASKDKPQSPAGVTAEAYVEKKQPLYQVFATKLRNSDLSAIGDEEVSNFWPLVAEVLDEQRQRIITALEKIDSASTVQDIKHLAANTPAVAKSMQAFAALYPLHEEFVHRYQQPSKLQHSWERIDLTYIGNFFTVIIGWHLGGWLLRKSVPTSYLLRYLTPTFGAIMPYTNVLMQAFWYVILVDYFGIKVWQTFVSKPRKLNTLQEYYYLGNQQDQFVSRTYLDYLDMERSSHILGYAFEAAMLGLFVGWWGYNHLLPHLVPGIKNTRLQRLFARIGFRTEDGKPLSEAEVFERRHEIFSRAKINEKTAAEIEKVSAAWQAGRISASYARQQTHRIELAREKIFTSMAKKERAIKVAEIEHKYDFRALGLSQPAFHAEEIEGAYSSLSSTHMANNDLLSHFAMRDAEIALMNLQISLARRLKFQIIRSKSDVRAKIQEMSTELKQDLAMFGVAPNRRDTFTRRQLEKIETQINSRFPAAQQTLENPHYQELSEAYNRIYRATEELEKFRIVDGWHSAMFEAIIDRRFGHGALHSEAELFDLGRALELLNIDLTDTKLSTVTESGRDKMPSFKLSEQWDQVVTRQYQRVVTQQQKQLDGDELQASLQELDMAKDILLRVGSSSGLQALLTRVRYENLYRIIDLDPKLAETYTSKEIRMAIRKTAVRYHPDKHPNASVEEKRRLEEMFNEVNRAKKLLQNSATKGRIDAYLRQHLHGEGES